MRTYTLTTYVLLGFVLFFLHSCSIEKRRYTGGFHIEKHHNHKRYVEPDIVENPTDSADGVARNESEHFTEHTQTLSDDSVESEKPLNPTEENMIASAEESSTPVLVSTNPVNRLSTHLESAITKYDHHSFAEKKKKKKNRGKQAGFMGVSAWIISVIAFVMAIGGSLTIGTYLMLSLTAFVLAVCALVFGAMSIKKARKGKGKGGAIIGIILGGLYLLLGIIGTIILLGA